MQSRTSSDKGVPSSCEFVHSFLTNWVLRSELEALSPHPAPRTQHLFYLQSSRWRCKFTGIRPWKFALWIWYDTRNTKVCCCL